MKVTDRSKYLRNFFDLYDNGTVEYDVLMLEISFMAECLECGYDGRGLNHIQEDNDRELCLCDSCLENYKG